MQWSEELFFDGSAMAGRFVDIDLLWRGEYSRDSCLWQDNLRDSRLSTDIRSRPSFPDLHSKRVEEEHTGRVLLLQQPSHGDFCVWKEKQVHPQMSDLTNIAGNSSPDLPRDTGAIVALLKACAKQKDLCNGRRLHSHVCRTASLQSNIYVSTGIVSMYAKCGALAKAQEVFDELPVKNIVSWNAIIAGYAQHGHGGEALICYEKMQEQGLSPNAVTFTCALQACGRIGAAEKGEEIHAEVVRQGLLKKDSILGTALVGMYAKCGVLTKAREVFEELPVQNIVSWNVLIAGYVQHGHGHEALNCFEQMQQLGLSPNAVTFSCILKACGTVGAGQKGEEIHAEVVRQGMLGKNTILGTALVDMYAKCGAVAKMQQVFDELPVKDVLSWSALIGGYAQNGHGQEALNCYEKMQQQGLTPDAVTYICLLKACSVVGAAEEGEEIHAAAAREGLLVENPILGTALVDMYAKCGVLGKAQEVFDRLAVRNVVSWNALIAGYAQHGCGHEALNCFGQMQREGLFPDIVTFNCILKACGSIVSVQKGAELHAEIVRRGLLEEDTILGSALVDMYAKCGALLEAHEVFKKLPVQDVVSWSSLIAGYVKYGHGYEALNCFEQMRQQGLSLDAVTFTCIFKACGIVGALEKGEEIHAEVANQGLLEYNAILSTSLVDMYAKCGALSKAQALFDELPVPNLVTWGALITGYTQNGYGHEALNCFEKMQNQGLSPDAITFSCILKACGSIGAAEKGEEIHAEVVRRGLLQTDAVLGTALVDMYAKCGALAKAQELFEELPVQGDVISWNALITGYSQVGKVETVFSLFNKMIGKGIEPDSVTFLVLLNACSHSGLVDQGQMYFVTMSTSYGIIPTLDHHVCMVDLFGRAGHFDKAIGVIEKVAPLTCSNHLPLWCALLAACQKWGNVELGSLAFERAVQLDAKDATTYILMSNIYAAASMLEEAKKIEAMRVKNKAWRMPGWCWWTDASGNVHSFVAGDTSHPQSKIIYAKLEDIGQRISEEGYFPTLHEPSQDISNYAKQDVLCRHSEKLAIACALINTPEGTPIHVTKNMRDCGDCHFATSLISKLEERKIVIRDAHRFHIFEDGRCSCGGYC